MPIEEDLQTLDIKMKQLKLDYERYFLGTRPREPAMARSEGDFGVLEAHERFLSALRTGVVEIRAASGSRYAAIDEGFAEVTGERVTVLSESCEIAGDIDVARAEMARDRASEGLGKLESDDARERIEEYETALRRAENRLAVSRKANS